MQENLHRSFVLVFVSRYGEHIAPNVKVCRNRFLAIKTYFFQLGALIIFLHWRSPQNSVTAL